MKSAFTQSMYSGGEHRLIFLETPDNQEVQVPKIETGGEASEDTINLQSTDQKNIEAVAANAQNSAQEKVDRFDADLKKTENTDGSTTVDLNLKLTIPGAAKIAELFKKFASKKESQQTEQTTATPDTAQKQGESEEAEQPVDSSLAPILKVAENVLDQITAENNDKSSVEAENQAPETEQEPEITSQANEASEAEVNPVVESSEPQVSQAVESSEKNESLEAQLKDALVLIQKQQEQIDRLTALIEQQQARLDGANQAPAQNAPDKAPNREPLTPRSPDASSADTPKQAPSLSEQRETVLTPREALVRSAKDAMNSDPALSSDMGRLYQFFETQKNNLPQTYEAMEDNQPGMYYKMTLASAKMNTFAFEISKLDPKIISDGRRSIQATPQGTFDFMKEVMMSSGSGMTRAPDVISNAVRNKASGTPQPSRVEAPATNGSPQPTETPDTPSVANAPEAPAVREEVPATGPAVPEEVKEGLSAESLQGLKNALGTLADTVAMQSDGNATIDLSNAIKNPVAKDGMTFILDALQIQHENGKIAVTPQNIAAITAAIGKAVEYAQKLNSGDIADLPPEVSQKILDAVDKQLPKNMRGKLEFVNGNIVLDARDALSKPFAKNAFKLAKLEVEDGKIIIKPQDIAKVIGGLALLERFFDQRQKA